MAVTDITSGEGWITPEWSFGERLAKARRIAGLTQDDMGERMNVSPSTIAAWETGRSQPRGLLAMVQEWAEQTGVDPGWIVQNWK